MVSSGWSWDMNENSIRTEGDNRVPPAHFFHDRGDVREVLSVGHLGQAIVPNHEIKLFLSLLLNTGVGSKREDEGPCGADRL